MSHTCHALGCEVEIPAKLLMCARHWRMVPRQLQREVWKHYRRGQEKDKQPSMDYMFAATEAVDAVAEYERAAEVPAGDEEEGDV